MIRKRILIWELASLMILSGCGAKTYEQKIQKYYGSQVAHITPEDLARKMKQDTPVYLLDTRRKKEFNVSHLKNARWVGDKEFALSKVKDIPRDGKIVTYCTVGYRSEEIAERLLDAGYKDVSNLYGSIILWNNKGYPVYDTSGDTTRRVHTYSGRWAKWLKKGEAVYE